MVAHRFIYHPANRGHGDAGVDQLPEFIKGHERVVPVRVGLQYVVSGRREGDGRERDELLRHYH